MTRIEIIMGCMFSGKSTELIRRLKRHRAINESILVINSAKDTRSANEVIKTHNSDTFDCVKVSDLSLLESVDVESLYSTLRGPSRVVTRPSPE